ncbi:MAG: hypothetical protein ACRECJ_11060, partial [Limisphaerales bacterium]
MKHEQFHVAWIENENGERLKVTLTSEGETFLGKVFINGIPYHVFFADGLEIKSGGKYILDTDPDYSPK